MRMKMTANVKHDTFYTEKVGSFKLGSSTEGSHREKFHINGDALIDTAIKTVN